MNIFGFFSSSSNNSVTVPTFEQGEGHDSIDLQVKSLLYIFKRLRLNKLSLSLERNGTSYSLKYTDGNREIGNSTEVLNYFQKLDTTYNVEKFKQVIINDEYRIIVDFIKNKFRSYCILSDYPSESVSTSNKPTANREFPDFKDYKDRDVKHFRFSIMPLQNTSVAFIANTLSMSDIYVEHHYSVEFNARYQYAMEAINNILDFGKEVPDKDSQINITENDKAKIISYYLRRLAFIVQLNRIYEETLKHQVLKASPIKLSAPSSPSKSVSSLPPSIASSNSKLTKSMTNLSLTLSPPKLSPRKSMADLGRSRSPSPTRTLKSKPSIAKMKMNELFNTPSPAQTPIPQTATNVFDSSKSDTSSATSLSNDNGLNSPKKFPAISTEMKLDTWEKCKQAIKDKLELERIKVVGE